MNPVCAFRRIKLQIAEDYFWGMEMGIMSPFARFLLVFLFPYPKFDAVLEDVNRLNFGNTHLVWDDSGKPIEVRRD